MLKKIFIYIVLSLNSLLGGLFYTSNVKTATTVIVSPTKAVINLAPVEPIQIKENRLQRLSQSKGLPDADTTDRYIEEQLLVTRNSEQISNYQAFVTPENSIVVARASGKSTEQIYQDTLTWVWVEDIVLNGATDKWLLPEAFLSQTPTITTNPASGRVASDCEEHAYTLVSMLRASGVSADNVRVVTGKVSFSGTTGGHAWVEIYDTEKNGWFQLEPSSGDNYNSTTKELVRSDGLAYDYFKTHQYPAIEVWTYFNDKYFWDNNRQQGVRSNTWEIGTVEKSASSSGEMKYQLPEKIKQRRQEFIQRFEQNHPRPLMPTGTITPPVSGTTQMDPNRRPPNSSRNRFFQPPPIISPTPTPS